MLIQAVVGLWTGSAEIYLAIPVVANAGYGLVFIGSTVIGRPLAGVFAEEMLPLPDEVKASRTHRRVFGQISLAWGAYMVSRSVLRLIVLAALGVDVFVAVGTPGVPANINMLEVYPASPVADTGIPD